MPTVAERLSHITPKVERAREHISALQRELKDFIATDPYKVACKVDGEQRPVYFVLSVEPTPARLPLIAGDAIQNLMCALDHLAYQLVCSDTGDQPPNPNWIYFPIQDDEEKYHAKKQGKIAGASQATVAAIDALKPYKGGNEDLWMLYRLNNIEKHRLLLTVGSSAGGVHLGSMAARLFEAMGHTEAASKFAAMTQYIVPADKGFPLKPGFELFKDSPGSKPDPKQKFLFDVALSEPGIVEGALFKTLTSLTATVEHAVEALTPNLIDTP